MNSLNGKPVKLAGKHPVLTILFGNATAGVYRFFLFDSNNQNPQKFGDGLSNDNQPDVCPVPIQKLPQAVQVEFGVHPLTQIDTAPVTLVLTESGAPFWSHTYLIGTAEFNKGLVDFFFLTK